MSPLEKGVREKCESRGKKKRGGKEEEKIRLLSVLQHYSQGEGFAFLIGKKK